MMTNQWAALVPLLLMFAGIALFAFTSSFGK